MSFRYKHLSPIYAGKSVEDNGTLNASYFKEFLFDTHYDFNQLLPFTQRIPKIGFFSELSFLETEYFKSVNPIFIEKIKKEAELALEDLSSFRKGLNYLNLLTRYGAFNLPKISSSILLQLPDDLLLEYELIKIGAKSNEAISNDEPIIIEDFIKITKKAYNNAIPERIKILIGNRLIVNSYRFSKDFYSRAYAREIIAPQLLTILDKLPDDFMSQLYKSIAYRGIAMISEWGETQNNLLNSSEKIARNLKPETALDVIVTKENLYTLLQTLSKWRAKKYSNLHQAELDLHEMIQLDSYDSTAYSEMGLFLSKQERFEEAAHHFKLAADFGPPAVGMNLYFYAKCIEKIKGNANIIYLLQEVISADPESISAMLDLVGFYEKSGEATKLQDITKHILSTPSLVEQLEENEQQRLQLILLN